MAPNSVIPIDIFGTLVSDYKFHARKVKMVDDESDESYHYSAVFHTQ
jgi:hypothetical protein